MALQKRSYLPRSTIDYTAIRAIYHYAESREISFGKAVEQMLLGSKDFNESLKALADGSEWFKKDIEDFKESL